MIGFEDQLMLALFLIIPLVVLIHFFSLVGSKRNVYKFANYETIQRITGQKIVTKDIPTLIIRVVFLTILILAISGFYIEIEREGFNDDILFAIDTSGSMLANDTGTSRLKSSTGAVSGFIQDNTFAGEMSYMTFTSVPYLEVSPTMEKEMILRSLNQTTVRMTGGTSLGIPISFATSLKDEDKEMSLFLITDGQENLFTRSELKDVVQEAAKERISIHSIGIGTDEGASIDENIEGASVVNEDNFRLIANLSKGNYSIARSQEEIREHLETMVAKDMTTQVIQLRQPLFLVAIILLVVEWYFTNYLFRPFP